MLRQDSATKPKTVPLRICVNSVVSISYFIISYCGEKLWEPFTQSLQEAIIAKPLKSFEHLYSMHIGSYWPMILLRIELIWFAWTKSAKQFLFNFAFGNMSFFNRNISKHSHWASLPAESRCELTTIYIDLLIYGIQMPVISEALCAVLYVCTLVHIVYTYVWSTFDTQSHLHWHWRASKRAGRPILVHVACMCYMYLRELMVLLAHPRRPMQTTKSEAPEMMKQIKDGVLAFHLLQHGMQSESETNHQILH